jgi:hypothetical protein
MEVTRDRIPVRCWTSPGQRERPGDHPHRQGRPGRVETCTGWSGSPTAGSLRPRTGPTSPAVVGTTSTPSANGCEDCLRTGDSWVHLRLCMTCGHVGCCDSSPNRHATAHWHGNREHPIIRSFEPGRTGGGATSTTSPSRSPGPNPPRRTTEEAAMAGMETWPQPPVESWQPTRDTLTLAAGHRQDPHRAHTPAQPLVERAAVPHGSWAHHLAHAGGCGSRLRHRLGPARPPPRRDYRPRRAASHATRAP